MKILLLGGTADARVFTKRAYEKGLFNTNDHSLIYSVAGLVRQPDVPCEVISGGFTQFGGLKAYIRSEGIGAVLDMTHPYAAKMSSTAIDVCNSLALPYWRFSREPWVAQKGDNWISVSSWADAVTECAKFKRILLTVGQLSQDDMTRLSDVLATQDESKLIYRTAAPSRASLSGSVEWIKAIGPFDLESERALLQVNRIDCLVTKNSGGDATQAKLVAAREFGVQVVMLTRPNISPVKHLFSDLDDCLHHV
ncbi:hypothetical protein A3755_09540, partial [Oleiphilus sp. HI0085]